MDPSILAKFTHILCLWEYISPTGRGDPHHVTWDLSVQAGSASLCHATWERFAGMPESHRKPLKLLYPGPPPLFCCLEPEAALHGETCTSSLELSIGTKIWGLTQFSLCPKSGMFLCLRHGVTGQVGCGFEQPHLTGGIPSHGRGWNWMGIKVPSDPNYSGIW